VRFRHQSWVHDFVRDAVRDQLMLSRPAPSFSPHPQPAATLPYSDFSQMMQNDSAAQDSVAQEFVLHPAAPPAARFDFGEGGIPVQAQPAAMATPAPLKLRVPDTHGGFPSDSMPVESSMARIGDLRPLGQLHHSFIIAAGRDGLWSIDQHVAH